MSDEALIMYNVDIKGKFHFTPLSCLLGNATGKSERALQSQGPPVSQTPISQCAISI